MAFIPNDPPRRREAVAAIPNPRSQEITVSDILAQSLAAIAQLGADAVDIDNKVKLATVKVGRDDGASVEVPVVVKPDGQVQVFQGAIEAGAREMPPRRQGLYQFATLASLCAFTNRFKTVDSMAFFKAPHLTTDADGDASIVDGKITVVFDDQPVEDSFGSHGMFKASMPLELGLLMKRYLEMSGTWLSAETFLGFIDERTDDLVSADLVSVVNNVGATTQSSWTRTVSPEGKIKIRVEDETGPSVSVPRSFAVRLPVFSFDRAGDVVELVCSLRTRVSKKQLEFSFAFQDLDERIAQAVEVAKATFEKEVPDVSSFLGVGR